MTELISIDWTWTAACKNTLQEIQQRYQTWDWSTHWTPVGLRGCFQKTPWIQLFHWTLDLWTTPWLCSVCMGADCQSMHQTQILWWGKLWLLAKMMSLTSSKVDNTKSRVPVSGTKQNKPAWGDSFINFPGWMPFWKCSLATRALVYAFVVCVGGQAHDRPTRCRCYSWKASLRSIVLRGATPALTHLQKEYPCLQGRNQPGFWSEVSCTTALSCAK